MRNTSFLTAVLITFVSSVMFVCLSTYVKVNTPVEAYETQCPWDINDPKNWETCLEFFEQQSQQIGSEKQGIQGSINAENYEQMSLFQQINYIANQVTLTELQIAEAEVSIEATTLEINLLGREIIKTQNRIDVLTQEINQLESVIKKRTTSSYKMTFMTPLEIMLDANNFESLLRRMKYLIEAKKQDREIFSNVINARSELADENSLLESSRSDVQEKRNEVENRRVELADAKINLENQRAQQQVLLAESQRREAEYLASLAGLQEIENQANMAVAQLIMRMFENGQLGNGTSVSVGDYIGFQGHTGCSYGSHLHFSVNSGTKYSGWGYFWGDINPYGYVSSSIPMNDPRYTNGYHQGMAIDLVSTTSGNQMDNTYGSCWSNPTENQCYYATRGSIPCNTGYQGWLSLEGEGAPIKSVSNGKVYYGTEGVYGGKYAMVVENGTGYVSIYLHLQ